MSKLTQLKSKAKGAIWLPFLFANDPPPAVNIKFHQAFVTHFQQKGLADLLIRDIGASHDLVHFERLLAESA